MKTFRLPLKAVLYREDGRWIAHCLELDVIGDGPTVRKAMKEMFKAMAAQIQFCVKHNCRENLFVPADKELWAMFATGKNIAEGEVIFRELKKKKSPVEIEDFEARAYSEESVDCEEGELVEA
jgi:hypothetical protein